jgi:predicted DsbA family dithiol-disulfide isomerase
MKHCKYIISGLALVMVVITVPAFAATAGNGQDDRVQWTQVSDLQLPNKPLDIAYSLDGNYAFILTDSKQVLVYNQQGKLQGRIPAGEGVSAIDISPRGEFLYLIDNKDNRLSTLAVDFILDIDISDSPIKGKIDAPVTVAVFSDFECSYCSKLLPILEQALKQNPETVKIAFKNLPLQNHKMAGPAALAALAAKEQGKFWEFHDRLFAEEKVTTDSFTKIATELGLNQERFNADQKSPLLVQKLNKDMAEAYKFGITGTPAVFVNGKKLNQRTIEELQRLIDEELSKPTK